MATDAHSPATQPTAATLPGTLLINLVVLLCIGVGASAWTLAYTDWFPAVGGLLALGGLFSWLAFVSKLLPKEVTEQLQQKLVTALGRRGACIILTTLFLALAVTASFFGAIQIEVQSTAQIHGFDLFPEGSGNNEPRVITPQGASSIPVLARFGHGGSKWRIKIPGYPYQPVTVSSFQRPTLYVPQSFKRRVLLVVPSNELIHNRAPYTLRLTIRVGNDRTLVIDDYKWFVFWIGCGPDVQIPAAEQIQLRAEKTQLRPMLAEIEYPPKLDVSINTPFSRPEWLGEKYLEKDLEFPLSEEVTITAEDVSPSDPDDVANGEGRNPKTSRMVMNKTVLVRESKVSFVQVVYLEKSDWKTPNSNLSSSGFSSGYRAATSVDEGTGTHSPVEH